MGANHADQSGPVLAIMLSVVIMCVIGYLSPLLTYYSQDLSISALGLLMDCAWCFQLPQLTSLDLHFACMLCSWQWQALGLG